MDTAPAPFGSAPSPLSPPPTCGAAGSLPSTAPPSPAQPRPAPPARRSPGRARPWPPPRACPSPAERRAAGAAGPRGRAREQAAAPAHWPLPLAAIRAAAARAWAGRGAGGGRGERLCFQPRVRRRPGLAGGAGGTAPRPEAAAAAAALFPAAASPVLSVVSPPAAGNGRERGGGRETPTDPQSMFSFRTGTLTPEESSDGAGEARVDSQLASVCEQQCVGSRPRSELPPAPPAVPESALSHSRPLPTALPTALSYGTPKQSRCSTQATRAPDTCQCTSCGGLAAAADRELLCRAACVSISQW
ncbi:unnamed protein product [Rangifer tarandus platyrhynchus]|uniref:Uncharacterized protein n=2 Tax=Rangifer tarandus platyrhynchus TaxID=3082113 RepID=A0ACB0F309_RANTA|nr:unnamed protein product [Rangifer tarandus platyrhynchus]CAI9706506.1 unnamed protein product [Rangifer tarandus platyrhynchus]